MASSKAVAQIKSDEGFLSKAKDLHFKGAKPERSIGHGFNLNRDSVKEDLILAGISPSDVAGVIAGSVSITKDQADALFQQDVVRAERDARGLVDDYDSLPPVVRDVLTNMSFQMGVNSLKDFKDTITAINNKDWDGVKTHMMASDWARTTSKRAKRLLKTLSPLKTEKVATTAVGKQREAKESYSEDLFNSRVDSLSQTLSSEALIDRLADNINKTNAMASEEQPAPEEAPDKPKLFPLRRGLFEDESGKKFFVDNKDRMLELGEDNKPKTIIDPSTFDVSGLEQTSEDS